MTLSIIVPVMNEQESLAELHRQIGEACARLDSEHEIVFVDDGSTDASWSVITQLAEQNDRVSGIRFRRNFGKAAALTAAMRAARGRLILMMDADLQDDPAEIPRLIDKLEEGYDVVNGWKQHRQDPWHKVIPSRVFNWLIGRVTGLELHDHNCGLKLFRREVASEIRIYGELHRFIPVLAHARGFRVTEIAVHHRPRVHGSSKYGVARFLRGFLDVLTVKFLIGFGQRPQHLLGAFGLLLFGLGMVGLGYLAVIWLLTNVAGFGFGPIGTRPLLAYSVAVALLGAMSLFYAFLAALVVYYNGRESDTYGVAERTPRQSRDRETARIE